MNKSTLLLINDFLHAGGAEKVFRDTAEVLKHDYYVHTYFGTEQYSTASNFSDYIYSKKYRSDLLKKLQELNPDIIHLHGYYHILSPSILDAIRVYKKDNLVKVVYTAHDSHLIGPNSVLIHYSRLQNQPRVLTKNPSFLQILFLKWDHRSVFHSLIKKIQWINAYWIRRLYRSFDLVVSPSQYVADRIKQKYSFLRAELLRNPISFSGPVSPHTVHPYKEIIRIMFVGRLSQEKNLLSFLSCLKDSGYTRYHLTIIGDGPETAHLVKFVTDQKLTDQVTLKGRVSHDEVMAEMKLQHCLVLCSLNETAPLSLVEAALSGLRLLTLDKFGMKEIGDICGGVYYFSLEAGSISNSLELMEQDLRSGAVLKDRDVEKIQNIFKYETYRQNLLDYYKSLEE